jgi:hypothetical protein
MTKKINASLIGLTLLVFVVAFQNCAKTNFEEATHSEAVEKDNGNGGNYDGKISYVVADLINKCGDGSAIRSRIDRLVSKYHLMRENCLDITPRELDPASVSIDATQQFLNYAGQVFTQVRDPWLQPFSSASIWNTSIGSGAMWSQNTDPDTIDLHAAGSEIDAGSWSTPFFLAKATDVSKTVSSTNLVDQILSIPVDFHLSGPTNGSKAFVLMDPTKRWLYQYTACRATSTGYSCDYGIKDDTCSDGLGGFDVGRGMMRAWEVQSGEIKHAIRFALPLNLLKSTGVAWPAQPTDFEEGLPNSTGNITYGSTVGIPANVDLSLLNLSRGGKILAKALQEYGAIQRDSSGTSGGIIFYAEEAAESLPQLAEMRADLAKIVPHLKIMRNQSPSTTNGGGTRRQVSLPVIDPAICQ